MVLDVKDQSSPPVPVIGGVAVHGEIANGPNIIVPGFERPRALVLNCIPPNRHLD